MNQTAMIDVGTREVLQKMVLLARQGLRGEARRTGKAALSEVGQVAPLQGLLGRLACEEGDFDDGIAQLRAALDALPNDIFIRTDLTAALIQTGNLQDALAVCDQQYALADQSLQLARFRGYVAQQLEMWPEAIMAYRHVLAGAPDDAGTWNNLGNALSSSGDREGAVQALRRAAELDPQAAPTRLNLAGALSAADRLDEAVDVLKKMADDFPDDAKPWSELGRLADFSGQGDIALQACEEAARRAPNDPEVLLALGNQRGAEWDTAGAEAAHRAAIAADPSFGDAYVALAVLYEHHNRADQLPMLLAEAEAADIDPGLLALVRAHAFRRAKNWQAALDAALGAREDRDPVRRAQIIGESLERLGRTEEAFAWYETMNRLVAESPRQPAAQGAIYRQMVERNRATLTADWLTSWTPQFPPQKDEHSSPAFLLGFPRSGTTLLDTMLMGHPKVRVMEERPAIVHVEQRLGDVPALPGMDQQAIREARDDYWREAANYADVEPDSLLVDKSPLYLNKMAVIHRLFPDAPIILALRHPMDAVLSCFVTNFRPNPAMANFLDLRGTAELYDQSMAAFHEAWDKLGLDVHTVVYERMVADRDAELRPLVKWLGLDWHEEAMDHQKTAATRGTITTASYSQVHEPLYTRSAGRWSGFREQLEPVRDILAPWVEKFGYSLDDPTKVPERKAT